MGKLLEVNDLKTYFYTRSGIVKAVDGLSFSLNEGETLGIVGESGSGKSVSMMSILGLIPKPPGKVLSGTAFFKGTDLLAASPKTVRSIRGHRIAMIFQDPMTSLNPYLKVSTQLMEVLTEHEGKSNREARKLAVEALEQVGIPGASSRIDQYPHQFSGGMRQRVMIAMAIIAKPDIIIADEPTTALDVTIQAQILELLKDMQTSFGLGLILITHDLGVVAGMSDKLLVMYAGRMVEQGSCEDIFYRPHHPYTRGLLKSVPQIDHDQDKLYSIPGLPPDPSRLPKGCAFAPRCERAMKTCVADVPLPNQKIGEQHNANCYLESSV